MSASPKRTAAAANTPTALHNTQTRINTPLLLGAVFIVIGYF